jgi:hypothetical protein
MRYLKSIKESLESVPQEIIDNFQELEDDGALISYFKVPGPLSGILTPNYVLSIKKPKVPIINNVIKLINRLENYKCEEVTYIDTNYVSFTSSVKHIKVEDINILINHIKNKGTIRSNFIIREIQ